MAEKKVKKNRPNVHFLLDMPMRMRYNAIMVKEDKGANEMDKTKEVMVWLDETPGWEPGWVARRKGFPAEVSLLAKTAEEAVEEASQRFPGMVVKVVEVDPPKQPSASSRKLMSDVAALEQKGIGTRTAMFLALETE